jgi:uncharacterized protein YjbI with pentapeptide repeats
MKRQPATPNKFAFTRREPQIPNQLEAAEDGAALVESHDISIAERSIKGVKIEDRSAGALRIEASVLEGMSLSGSSFGSMIWKDVRVIRCDLANLETHGLNLIRVELIDCRMTGVRAGIADCQDVLFSGGDQRYSQFRFSRFKSAEFDSCNFADADFQGTDLSGSVFRRCNLENAEMSKAKLLNADLRGSRVEGLHMNAADIRGAVVDASQAIIFAALLGIRIE